MRVRPFIGEIGDQGERRSGEGPAPAFYKRRKKRGNEIGQILLHRKSITPEQLREALRLQRDTGGLVGTILTRMGACDAQHIAEALLEQVQRRRAAADPHPHASRARENPSSMGLLVRCQPLVTRLLTIGLDGVLLFTVPLVTQFFLDGGASIGKILAVAAVIAVLALFALHWTQFDSMMPMSAPEEIRRSTQVLFLVYVAASALGWLEKTGALAFGIRRYAIWVAWAASVVLVPIGRGLLRRAFAKKAWWGNPVIVLGAGKTGRAVVGTLQSHPELGLKPVAILDDDPEKQGTLRASWGEHDIAIESVRDPNLNTPSVRAVWGQFSEVEGVPVVGALDLAPALAQRLGIRSAIVAMPEMEAAALVSMLERVAENYTNVLVIPDLFNLAPFGAPARSLDRLLGIEVRRQLLLTGPRVVKRAMDLVFTLIGGILILPILLLLAILIRLDSAGPALYRQERVGVDGIRFSALKFRTMYGDGEKRLAQLLATNPALKAEYDQFHKLSADPRVTRIGRFLRKYSIDEFPQLWNVLKGEMSLVGPRPYLEREIPEMNGREIILLRVKPGITGIWQVTERNATSFDQRVEMDYQYVRNWTPWLDLYVIARTFLVLVGGTGS